MALGRYTHVRSLAHAERLLRAQATKARVDAGTADNTFDAAGLRGKADGLDEAANLLRKLAQRSRSGELDDFCPTQRESTARIHIGSDR